MHARTLHHIPKFLQHKLLLIPASLAATALLTLISPSEALARNFYVSLQGSNGDGTSWQTAWNELNQIKYNLLAPGDNVFIDGGNRGRGSSIYRTPLHVPNSINAVRFVQSNSDGAHDGVITIDGSNSSNTDGISIGGNYVSVVGGYQSGIIVKNFQTGVRTLPNTVGNFVQCIEVTNNSQGMAPSGQNRYDHLIIHDNLPLNVFQAEAARSNCAVVISNSWIYNQQPPTTNPYLFGLVTGANVYGTFTVDNCVIGPNLGFGIASYAPGTMVVTNTLFLNATYTNIYLDPGASRLNLSYITSFMTPLNQQRGAHNCLVANSGALSVDHSIFYGGQVVLPAGNFANTTTEFQVSGNTLALSNAQADPQFFSELSGQLPGLGNNPSFASFIDLNFGLSGNSPSRGEGSPIFSIQQKFF
jgi:hypothetical protein